jgi:hypothetical protein
MAGIVAFVSGITLASQFSPRFMAAATKWLTERGWHSTVTLHKRALFGGTTALTVLGLVCASYFNHQLKRYYGALRFSYGKLIGSADGADLFCFPEEIFVSREEIAKVKCERYKHESIELGSSINRVAVFLNRKEL